MASTSRKTVAILFLGGATIDERSRLGETVTKAAHVKPWLRTMLEMDIIAETEGVYITSGLTTIGLPEWTSAAESIKELYNQVDGFVIVHQLETLPAAAIVLSLMVQKIGKPVVMCGSSLLSLDEKKSGRSSTKSNTDYGAKASFINAVQVAVSDIAGIVIVHGSHIYRGSTIIGPMQSLKGEILGKIDFGIRFFGKQPGRVEQPIKLQTVFETKVAVAEYLPGVDLRHLLHFPRGTRAIFISSPDGATVIRQALAQLLRSKTSDIPMVIYVGPEEQAVPGTLSVHGASRPAALLRLMWALGQTTDVKKLKKLLS